MKKKDIQKGSEISNNIEESIVKHIVVEVVLDRNRKDRSRSMFGL